MQTADIRVTVNGVPYEKIVPCNQTLLRFLREDLFLTSVKEGCDEGECGACTVLLDGRPVNSCLVLAVELDGREVLTAEGLAEDGRLHPLQEAFIEAGAVQCGYCTPGMLISGIALLNLYPHPTREQIRKEMEGNICRCTGYTRIADAVLLAVEKMDAARAEARVKGLPEPEFRGIDSRFSEKWNSQYQS
ncbi:(2Fe-2S)-binding protein [uncultured Oscillibacter sp.]|uniref:(2Fe-2S)-binding protein n=1 Tax=uncultured Oscillibacter sp. TaxID=876091 RepID=UPI0026124FE5|nr:(2Fe-2S)-binding protein [uncultured Oscillibacter sp.]